MKNFLEKYIDDFSNLVITSKEIMDDLLEFYLMEGAMARIAKQSVHGESTQL